MAGIICLMAPAVRADMALFVAYSPDGYLRPHVRGYLEALVREGIAVALIVATDREFVGDDEWLREIVNGLFIRANEGFDFAAWAHILQLYPELMRAHTLYLLNDSVIGPVQDVRFHAVVTRVRNAREDLVGLTENYDRGWHIQSYFLALKPRALRSAVWKQFVQEAVSFAEKDDVINTYEVPLASAMMAAGLRTLVLFKSEFHGDLTVYRWRELLNQGFPFIKIKTIRDQIPGVDSSSWRETLAAFGFNPAIADAVLARTHIP